MEIIITRTLGIKAFNNKPEQEPEKENISFENVKQKLKSI